MDQSSSITTKATEQTLRFRMVTHITSAQSLEVGDVEGHAVSVARFSGLAFFADEVATVSFASRSDYINGEGEFVLYPIIVFDDRATLCIKSCGTGKVEGAKTKFVGTLTVLGGSGRFAGAKGEGTLTGKRYTPLSLGADLVSEYVVTLK